ncbi:MFS transporter [Nocardia sp. NPDC050378]|uniref:MFS transporter n=1 Tax=Nocardia sp. NPDC050378 TaxID=3155400 RepID=UPI0033C22C3C
MNIPVRWIILIGSFTAYLFDALEIVILSLALPSMRADLGVSVVQGGLLATATLLGIGASSVTVGRIADKHGRKSALLGSLALFGICTASVAVMPSFGWIMVLRLVAGFGLGGVWAIVSTYVVESWPERERGRAVAFVMSAFPVGGMLAALIAGTYASNWRGMFFVSGVGVIVPIVLIWRFFPESREWLDNVSARRAAGETPTANTREIFGRTLIRSTVLGTTVCSLALLGFWGASAWLPTFLAEDRQIPDTTVAVFISVLNLGMFFGYNVFGFIADKIGRKRALITSLLGTGLVLPLYVVAANETTLLVLGPAYAFFAVFTGILGSYLGELYPTELRATGAGFCFNVGRGISALAPLLLGYLAGTTGFAIGFALCGGLFLLAAVAVIALPERYSPVAVAPDGALSADDDGVKL